MNKILFFIALFFICSFAFAQNIDTTKYQKVLPQRSDTVRNYYDQNANNDTIRDYYPSPKQDTNNYALSAPYPKYNAKPKRAVPANPLLSKMYFGANLGLSYYATSYGQVLYYDISPNVGYKLDKIFSVGVQIVNVNSILYSGASHISYNIIGGGGFVRAQVLDFLFLQAEYDLLSVPTGYLYNAINHREISDEKLLGIGLKNRFSEMWSYYLIAMYDFEPTIYSPYYGNPIVFRAGIAYKF